MRKKYHCVKSHIIIILLFMGFSLSAHAQNLNLRGRVVDTEDIPLIGVNVIQKGTTNGIVTDLDGNFSLEVPANSTIVFSYIGFADQEVVWEGSGDLNIVLKEDTELLDELVVVGYGTQRRVNLTGAVSTVNGDELTNRLSHSVTNMLQGSVAGLNITTSSGKPGSSGAINIRGVNSINDTDPLVVIDGVTGDAGDLSRLNPNDIKSISVIKDASAAAVYGARAAFGVILVTTKSGADTNRKAVVRYSGRLGWEQPTTSTDYENRGYYSVYHVNKFWQADNGTNYIRYSEKDMEELWARVNDVTEHPDRPWVVEEVRNGRPQWVYYGNYDWWDMLYREKRPSQQHNISVNGGTNGINYMLSGNYNRQEGMQRAHPDVFDRYNLRSKIDFKVNDWATLSNNTAMYNSKYSSLGDDNIENTIAYSSRHALANFPMQNPDGSWIYGTPYLNYKVGNGRHIMLNEQSHRNLEKTMNVSNTTRLEMKPFETLKITGDFTYRFNQRQNTNRSQELWFRVYPDAELESYNTGAGENQLTEAITTNNFYSTNIFANYEETFNNRHNVSALGGFNYESFHRKSISAWGRDLSSPSLDDLNLVGQNEEGVTETGVGGGQAEYALLGFFGRLNYDYMGRYLFELSGRYDGSSRFGREHRWGWFPSASVGWRISEEPFFEPARDLVDNLKLRLSFGSLGNQNVSSYYTYMRLVSMHDFSEYTFGEGSTKAKYSSLSAPIASDMTWETVKQWNAGVDYSMLKSRLSLVADVYVRNTVDMLTEGVALPGVYGADSPEMNAADMQTRGYELSLNWRDQFQLGKSPFSYNVGLVLSDYKSIITKYDNPNKTFAKQYYEGMELGEIWGFVTDGLFQTDEEAKAYAKEVDLSYSSGRLRGGWMAGDLKFVDLDGNGIWGIGQNTVDNPGDRKILGNSLPTLSYGVNAGFDWMGFDASVMLQGTGNHYWYPSGHNMNFWGGFSYSYVSFLPKDFLDKVWSEENPDSYFPRARAYGATGGYLAKVNDSYLQNLRYLRLKNVTVGYTLPANLTSKIGIDNLRVYASGENLHYWSPLKENTKYIDPEAAFSRSSAVQNNAFYPWPATYMFGIDITF
jgi:TonB-linked SusC/RagA family outer membrane protein